MTPIAQVAHVFRKDLREHRVRVALFVALVLVTLARALGVNVPVEPIALAVLIFLAGIAIVGAPVDSDPPADARSAWASRPLSPSAVLAAKLAFGALLVLVAALAQAVALSSLDLGAADAVRYVTGPAKLLGVALLATLVVTAASADVRVRLLLVSVLLLIFALMAGGVATMEPVSHGVKAAATGAVAALMTGALFYFYRTRRTGRTPLAVALVVLASGGVAAMSRTLPIPGPTAGRDVPRAEIRVVVPPEAPVVRQGHVRVRISAAQPARGWQYGMRNPVLVVTLGGGRVIRLVADRNFMNLGGDPGPVPLPVPTPVATPVAAPAAPPVLAPPGAGEPAGWREVSIPVGYDLRVAEGDTIRQVTLAGDVLVTALRVVDTIPVAVGARHARRGVRSIIDSLTVLDGRPEIVLRAAGLFRPDDQSRLFPFASYFGRAYALLLPRGEPVMMRQTWTASSSGALVLPTSAFGDAGLRLTPMDTAAFARRAPSTRNAGPASDTGWLRDAKLLAIEPVPQGSYPVQLTWKRGG